VCGWRISALGEEPPAEVCLAKVGESEIFVGLVGIRYGSNMPGTEKSFSEAEYDEAVAAGKSILMYLSPEEFPIPGSMIERDEIREKQANFHHRVAQPHTVAFFQPGQAEQLAGFAIQALHNRRDDAVKEPKAVTRLLFPFLTNIGGLDTGITISNVSNDPFGWEQQDGTVTIYYYGRVVGGPAGPPPQTSAVFRPREQLMFTLSSGGTEPIQQAVGFTGHIIAESRFKAAGFAFISDLGAQKVATGYLTQTM
jgi:uncharacterized protein DUF4062